MMQTLDAQLRLLRGAMPTVLTGGVLATVIMAAVTMAMPRLYSSSAVIDAGTFGVNRGIDADTINANINGGGWRIAIDDMPAGSVRKMWLQFSKHVTTLRVDATDPATAQEAARRIAAFTITAYQQLPAFRDDQPLTAVLTGPAADSLRDQLSTVSARLRARAAASRTVVQRGEKRRAAALARLQELPAAIRRVSAGGGAGGPGRETEIARELEEVLAELKVDASDARLGEQIAALETLATALAETAKRPLTDSIVAGLGEGLLDENLSGIDEVEEIVAAIARVRAARAEDASKSGVIVTAPRVVLEPTLPAAHSWPNLGVNLSIAFIFGAMAGAFVSLLRREPAAGAR